jgi:hypothetical protein
MRVPAAVVQEMERFAAPPPDGVMVARVHYALEALGYEMGEMQGVAGAVFAGLMVMTGIADDALTLAVLRPHEAGAVRQMAKELAAVCAAIANLEVPA